MSADAFADLHPAVQYHVVNTLGWTELRPLQAAAIRPVLHGDDALLIAPTAGGKTEAALLPLLSRMAAGNWHGLSVVYVCPLRALLNNLEPRLAAMAGVARPTGRALARGCRGLCQEAPGSRSAGHLADDAGVP